MVVSLMRKIALTSQMSHAFFQKKDLRFASLMIEKSIHKQIRHGI